jgi:hypothetical protein
MLGIGAQLNATQECGMFRIRHYHVDTSEVRNRGRSHELSPNGPCESRLVYHFGCIAARHVKPLRRQPNKDTLVLDHRWRLNGLITRMANMTDFDISK